MYITKIIEKDKKKQMITLDNGESFPLYNAEVKKWKLAVDADISDSTYEAIYELLYRRIKERIAYLLDDCDRTERNIREKLTSNGYSGSVMDAVIEDMKQIHYIDDRRFATSYVDNQMNYHNKGQYVIRQKLMLKGVSKDLIDEVLSQVEFDYEEQIIRALNKKGYTTDSIREAEDKEKQKIFAYLIRQGYSMDAIRRCVR